ncbi:MAG: hypothetical protein ACOYN4_07505 [Bacteroidales bacterium]
MKKSFICIILLFLLASNIAAQNNPLKVFFSQGSVFVLSGNKKIPITPEMTITESNSILIDKNSSLILIAHDGKVLSLNDPGKYSFNNLLSIQTKSNKSLTNRYFTYVAQQMTQAHEVKKENISGGVFRGELLMCLPLDSCLIIQDSFSFSWYKGISSSRLYLTICKKNNKIIFSELFSDTSFIYNVKPKFNDQDFVWSVGYEPNQIYEINNRTFTVASLVTSQRLKKELRELESITNLPPEYKALLLLSFYEKNHLFIEANYALGEALSKYPENSLILEYARLLTKRYIK